MENEFENGFSEDVAEKYDLPPNFKVIFLNDDFTTMEFVVEVLVAVFRLNPGDAESVMESVHKTGRGVVGVYPYDIAASRARVTMEKAKEQGFPLRVILEKA